MQAESDVAPIEAEYFPAPQPMQAASVDAPIADEYVPAPQSMHVESAVAPFKVEYFPDPQLLQAEDPVLDLYFPGTHCEQGPPSGPDEPDLQMQAVTSELPACEKECSGHTEQIEPVVAPRAVEYLPAPQLMHAELPVSVLYLPARQL